MNNVKGSVFSPEPIKASLRETHRGAIPSVSHRDKHVKSALMAPTESAKHTVALFHLFRTEINT